jgi:outer membrane lipoprotein-sorting protein
MMKRMNWLMAILLTAVWGTTAAADDAETVQKAVRDKYKAIKSLRYKTQTKMEIDMQGYKNRSIGKGTFEMVRKDGKFLWRMESTTRSEMEIGGKVTKTDSTSLAITDGQYTWMYNKAGAQESATKTKLENTAEPDPFESYREHFKMSVLPDEKVDGHDCYVLQVVPKQPQGAGMGGKSVLSFRKDCGVMVRMVSSGPDGKPMSTFTNSDLEINTAIGADRFVFKAPNGVEVVETPQPPKQP